LEKGVSFLGKIQMPNSPDWRENPFCFFFKNKKIWKEGGKMDSEKA